ncbi:MAG: TIGR04348 family glycosyltransferase [Limnohabitans sp.]|nr:TIGR04348 family glycosyltransferase [Limnohabitans sp.]
MQKRRVVIVSPALADANNGNWQTARRWQHLLAPHTVRIVRHWPGDGFDAQTERDEVMLALHARRSADSVQAWHAQHGQRGLGLTLTGTDLYRDIAHDLQAQRSLALAKSLVVLQELGAKALPPQYQTKTREIYPSTGTRQTLPKTTRHLRVVMVGHLREEKDPLTLMAAALLLPPDSCILIDHIGAALDPSLGQAAQATQAQCPHYRWLGALPHAQTLQRIQRAHLLVHTSRMEGGAHVLMEAICSGTPVLASRIDGNLGLLGADYAGTFETGDAQGLADQLLACREPVGGAPVVAHLQHQCALRAPLFEPQAERAALHRWVQDLWTL